MWRRILPLFKPVAGDYARYAGGMLIRQILVVLGGYSLVAAMRVVSSTLHVPLAAVLGGLIVFDLVLLGMDATLGLFFARRVSLPLFRKLRASSLGKLLEMPLEWHNRQNTLELVSKLNTGAGKVVQTAEVVGRELVPATIRTGISLIPLLYFSPITAPVILAALIVFLWLSKIENVRRQPYRASRYEQYARDAGMFTECVQYVQPLVQFGQTERMMGRYERLQQQIVSEATAEINLSTRFSSKRNMSLSTTKRVCQGIWLWQFQAGHLDAPMVMYLNFLTEELINTFWTYASVLERMYEGIEPARVLVNLMDETPAIRNAPGVRPAHVPDEVSIELRDVSFGYDKDSPVLRDLSLSVEPGSVIGIVGRSGIGKTTLQHLLSRTYDVQSGSVSIAGVDVREWPLEQLRALFASVTQHGGVFFSGTTLLDTLRFARPDASYEQIVDATRCAAIHDDIMRMPDGYNTLLAPGGLNFSKGQQQRIALAQALLSLRDDRKILILDEFTSALDSHTEQQILHNLRLRLRGKTVIIIAHRLATLSRLADRIVVIENGAIAEEGSHTELMSRGNSYAHLVKLQNVA